MRHQLKYFLYILLTGFVIFNACKKEKSCEACKENNQPPISVAGLDQVIILPTDSISLDGSSSSDPDGTISNWLWTKISGPASFIISKALVHGKNINKYSYTKHVHTFRKNIGV